MMNELLQLGRILQQASNGATAVNECASPGDDQVRLRSLYNMHCAACMLCRHACLEQARKQPA